MLKPMTIAFLSCMFLGAKEVGSAQGNFWEQTGGPRSAHVNSLAIKSEDTVFAGTERGILRSVDNGETWKTTGLSTVAVNALVITPKGYIFAGADGAYIYRSRDNGISWDSVNINIAVATRSIISLAANSSGELVAGTEAEQNGIYRSTDDGDHWTLVGEHSYSCVVALNDSGHILIGSAVGTEGVARSTDHGSSWKWLSPPGMIGWITRLAVNSRGDVFAGTMFLGVFRSTNDGATWDSASSGLRNLHIADLVVASGDTLFATTFWHGVFRSGVVRSTDNGKTWTSTALDYAATALATRPGGVLFAGGVSLFRSSDYGDHWSRLDFAGWQDLDITALATNRGDTLYAADEGIFCSTDHGDSWRELIAGNNQDYWGLACIAINANGHLFASVAEDMGGRSYRSTDHGDHWQEIPFYLWWTPPAFNDSGHIFATTSAFSFGPLGVYRSTDNGDTWEPDSTGLPDYNCGPIVINSRGDLFVGTFGGGVYRSTNSGAMWTPVNSGLTTNYTGFFADLLTVSARGDIFAAIRNEENQNVFRSTDNGENWVFQYSMPSWIRAMVADAAGNLFVGTETMGVYRNGGQMNSGLTALSVNSFALDSRGYLFAGTGQQFSGSSVFRSVQPTTPVEDHSTRVPVACMLEQNYPNPFNPSTTIRYGLPHKTAVQLTVFNTLGQQVALLQNGEQDAGVHEVKFDGSNLASGVYFYRMQAGTYVETKKLLLIR